jgi:hypothetical protein
MRYASLQTAILPLELLEAKYGTPERARKAFQDLIWPNGFICRKCAGKSASYIATRDVYKCRRCQKQHSLTAGTLLHGARYPLDVLAFIIYIAKTHQDHLPMHLAFRAAECLGVSKRQLRRWRIRLKGPLTTANHAFLRAFLSDLGAW